MACVGFASEPAIVVTPMIEPVGDAEAVYVTSEPAALVITTHLVETTVVLVVVMVVDGDVDSSSAATRSEVCRTNSRSCTTRARRVM